jgi:hypothetical protein
MSRGFADLTPSLDKIIGSLGRLEGIASSIDKRLDMMSSAATRAAKANSVLDKSAVEASTAYKQLEASLNAVTAAQKKADAAQAGSLAMIDKQKAAIASLNAEMAKLRNTPMPSQPNAPRAPGSNGSQGNVGNIAAQFFDIGTTAAFMNPATVAIQQGPQLAQAFAGQSTKQALTSLAGGLAAIVSPMSLVAIGLTATAAAAIQYGVGLATASTETKKLDDVLKTHEGLLKQIDDRYGSLTEKARGFASETSNVLGFQSSSDVRALRSATNRAQYDVFDQTGSILRRNRGGTAGGNDLSVDSTYEPIEAALRKLRGEAKAGKPDFDAFYDSLYKAAALDPSFAKKADELALLVEQYRQGTKALEEMERVQRAIFNDRGPGGMLLSQGPSNQADMGKYAIYESQQRVAAQRQQQGFDAQIAGVNARTPQERAAAARASAAAQYNNDEGASARRIRIEQAGILALTQAEKQLSDARRDRAMSLEKTLQDQQTEIDLIGKTGGAATALRKEYELTSALRMEAARQGLDVDQKELDLIKERAAALGQLTDQYNQSKFTFEMKQQASDARLSPRDRQISTTLRQYGLPEDMQGANASAIGQQYDWQQAKEMAKGFGSAFSNELVSGSHDIGQSFLKGFQSAIDNQATKLWEKFFDSASNIFADLITGGKGSGGSAGGLVGSVAAAVSGKAANDNTSGAFSGLGKIMPVTSAPLGAVTGSGDSLAWNFWKSKGLPDHQVAGILGNIKAESAFNPSAIGDAGAAKGLYQWNDRAPKMLGAVGADWKNNPLAQHEFAYSELMGPENKAWQALTSAKSTREATAAFAGFERPRGFSWSNPEGAHNFSGRYAGAESAFSKFGGGGGADTSVDAVNNLAAASKEATVNLGGFGSGLDKMGKSLTSAFPAAPAAPGQTGGGGGFGGWLGSLFGGGLSSADIAKYTPMTGLFADGTNYAPGGMAIVGERGPELVNLPQGAQVFNTNKSAEMMKGSGGQGGNQRPQLNVYVQGGSGDNHIRELARQGAQEAVYQYNEGQINGGFGDNQKKYASRVG